MVFPNVLLFDVMGTLVHDPFFDHVPAYFGMPLKELVPQLRPGVWVQFELGQVDEETFFRQFFHDGRAYDWQGFKAQMTAGYQWQEGMPELLAELQAKGYPMHTLSNYTPWYQIIEQKLAVSRFVKWSFVSCETGVRKPDPRAYWEAAQKLGVSPQACVFIDDRKTNCDAARAIGMHAIEFVDTPSLRRGLCELGLLQDKEEGL